jgi:hypothetical protein
MDKHGSVARRSCRATPGNQVPPFCRMMSAKSARPKKLAHPSAVA